MHADAAPPAEVTEGLAPPRSPLGARLWTYQRERFPLAAYLPLIGVSAVAAAGWSAGARDAALPPARLLGAGAVTALAFFLLLRVADEHKDAAQDRAARPHLPVPRGLVTLAELRWVALALAAGVFALNAALAPRLLLALVAVAAWAALMAREFFAAEWLRARPAAYLLSHMGVMPLLFLYLTGVDWLAAGAAAPPGLAFFLGLAFANGILVEVGRKTKAPADERPGVDSYTHAWGLRAAPAVWLGALGAAAGLGWMALGRPGSPSVLLPLALVALLASAPAVAFLLRPSRGAAKGIEAAAGVWTLASYALLALAVR